MHVAFFSREMVWGGGEQFLASVAIETSRRGFDVTVVVHQGSGLHRELHGVVEVAPYGAAVSADVAVFNDFHSERRYAVRAGRAGATRVRVVHGWWQASALRNLHSRLAGVRLVTVSSAVRQAVLRSRFAPRQVDILPIGPDHATFQPPDQLQRQQARHRWGMREEDFVVAVVGRPQPSKRLPAAVRLIREAGGVPLVVTSTGGGDRAEEDVLRSLDQQVVASRAGRRLLPTEGPSALTAADAVLSASEFESLGISLMEAMACGLPVVCTAVGGPRDFLVDGKSGICAASLDEARNALIRLRDDAALRLGLGAAGREAVLERTVESVTDVLLA
jgi:glycosyltransferase involved in cell wall biosynthesis